MKIPVHENEQSLLPPADLPGEMEKLRDDLGAERDRYMRVMADFKNYRRRIERDGNKTAEESKRKMMLPLLDIVDDMEKAIQCAADAEQPFVKGMRIIQQKFLAVLETQGVLPFESVGLPFDHHLHEAVAMTHHKDSKPGTVIDELRRGYLWNQELLRTSQVRVAE
jgi:molecular chaperone GrpE